jgi:hypothetical protein
MDIFPPSVDPIGGGRIPIGEFEDWNLDSHASCKSSAALLIRTPGTQCSSVIKADR